MQPTPPSASLEIFGHTLSQPSRSVLTYCSFSKLPFKFRHIEFLNKEHLSADYGKINPFQEIPAILHGNFAVWESAAIIAYLADAFNLDNQWYPKDIQVRARINAYLHWHHGNIRTPLVTYLRAKVVFPRFFGAKDPTAEAEAAYKKRITELFEDVSWILKSTGYAARTPYPTIADVFLFSEIATGLMLPIDLTPYPTIQKWYSQIKQFQEVKESHETIFSIIDGISASPKI